MKYFMDFEFIEGDKFLQSKLRPLQRKFLEDLYAIDKKGNPVNDTGVFIAGMRGGKSMLAAYVAAFQLHRLLALDDPAVHGMGDPECSAEARRG